MANLLLIILLIPFLLIFGRALVWSGTIILYGIVVIFMAYWFLVLLYGIIAFFTGVL
jgi:hypothetical protein